MTQLVWFTVLNIYFSSSNSYIKSEEQNKTYRTKKNHSLKYVKQLFDCIPLLPTKVKKERDRERENALVKSLTVIKPFFIEADQSAASQQTEPPALPRSHTPRNKTHKMKTLHHINSKFIRKQQSTPTDKVTSEKKGFIDNKYTVCGS